METTYAFLKQNALSTILRNSLSGSVNGWTV